MFCQMFAPWARRILSLGQSLDHSPVGRLALPGSWQQAAPAFSCQVINACVCFQRKGVSGTVSEWKYLHSQELWEWGKNKQGKTFQGKRGKTRTKRVMKREALLPSVNGRRRHLSHQTPHPCSEERDPGVPLLSLSFLGQQCTFC